MIFDLFKNEANECFFYVRLFVKQTNYLINFYINPHHPPLPIHQHLPQILHNPISTIRNAISRIS